MPACLNAPATIPRHRKTLGPLVSDIVSLLDGEFSKCGEIGVSAGPLRCACQRCPKSKHDAWARNYLQTLYTRAANRVSRVASTTGRYKFPRMYNAHRAAQRFVLTVRTDHAPTAPRQAPGGLRDKPDFCSCRGPLGCSTALPKRPPWFPSKSAEVERRSGNECR